MIRLYMQLVLQINVMPDVCACNYICQIPVSNIDQIILSRRLLTTTNSTAAHIDFQIIA